MAMIAMIGTDMDSELTSSSDKRALPKWRYRLRQRLLPLVRWETPYLAYFQNKMRSPALDSYFAITANLGTHTFFMIGLPMLFWFDYQMFGKGYVDIIGYSRHEKVYKECNANIPQPRSHSRLRRLLQRLHQRHVLATPATIASPPPYHHVRLSRARIWLPVNAFNKCCICRRLRRPYA